MGKITLEDKLHSLDAKDLYNLVIYIIYKNYDARRIVLEWFKENESKQKSNNTRKEDDTEFINDELLMEYWGNAREIISEFNEYGGGPEDEEDEAYHWLNKISDLIKEGRISSDAKYEFLDEAFVEYDVGNSGFDDALMDIFFEICDSKEEWEYLVEKLGKYPSDWRKHLIIKIQKDYLQNDEAYLKERMSSLRYGMDYLDLVDYYIDRNNYEKALETAEAGILKGEGRLTELFEFLFEHFEQANDAKNLERIVSTALSRNKEQRNMLDRLFEYYKNRGNYEKAKEALQKSYEHIRHASYYEEYVRIKNYLEESDWKQFEPRIINDAREKSINDYLRICLDKNMKKAVLDIILNPPRNQWGFVSNNNFDEFAGRLEKDYPDKIIEYYWKKACILIKEKNRDAYRESVRYLAKVKHIYINILKNEPVWIKRFSALKNEYSNRPAFLDESRNL